MAEAKKAAGKKKKQPQKLGDFLGVKPPTSWADDGEDEFMAAAPVESARDASDWRGGGGGSSRTTGDASRSGGAKTLPDRPPFTLFVGSLAFTTTEDDIARFFKNVESVRLVIDKSTNQSKGYGYVTFPTRDDLANALKLDNQDLGGRNIRLDVAQDNRGGKGKGGGGFGGSGFGDGSGGFGSGGFSGGREFMGTGQVERSERTERGGKGGGFGGGGGGGGWDLGRDAMGSAMPDERPSREPRAAVAFSRDTMGSEQGQPSTSGGPFGGKGERRGFGSDPDGWAAGRDAMGTGVVEERRPPPDRVAFSRDTMASEQPGRDASGEGRPATRGGPSRLMFGRSDTAPSRDLFGAEEVPERQEPVEPPPRPEPWRPGGGKGKGGRPPAELGDGGSWRSSAADTKKEEQASPAKEIYQPKNRQTNTELEAKKEKPVPKVPLTQEELFQQQVAKTQKKEQQAKAAKEKGAVQANFNPWEALGKTKKKKKNKKKDDGAKEAGSDNDEEDAED